jgi:hypothetical protein
VLRPALHYAGARSSAPGGIGGLLARSHGYNSTTRGWSTHHHYHADGGGNITALLDNNATSAALSASYRYDPYERLISSSGSMAIGLIRTPARS